MNEVIGMNEDLQILDGFLGDLDRLLNFAFDQRDNFMSPDLAGFLAEAWPSYGSRMTSMRAKLAAFAPEEMGLLTYHGLTGPELRLKMAGFNEAVLRVDEFFASKNDEAQRGVGFTLLRKGLGWGNIALASLPIPGKGAIEELKKVVERAIEDAENPWTEVPSIAPR